MKLSFMTFSQFLPLSHPFSSVSPHASFPRWSLHRLNRVLQAAESFPAAKKSEKRGKGKDWAEGLGAVSISFTQGVVETHRAQRKRREQQAWGGHTLNWGWGELIQFAGLF